MSKVIQFKPRLGSSDVRKRLNMQPAPSGLDSETWVSVHDAVKRVIAQVLKEQEANGKTSS